MNQIKLPNIKRKRNSSTEISSKVNDNQVNLHEGKQSCQTGFTTKNEGIKHVSFQTDAKEKDDFHLPPQAFLLYRKARNAKLTRVKYQERAEHLLRLIVQKHAPI